jgi:hypothetical protein
LDLVFEFVVWIKREDAKFEIPMSNGYARVRLAELQKGGKFTLNVIGGNPAENDLMINPDDIRKGRKGFVANFLKIFEGKISPSIEISCEKVDDKLVDDALFLPDMIVTNLCDLKICSIFRQILGFEAFRYPNMTNVDLDGQLFVKTFLNLLDLNTVKMEFIKFFEQNIQRKFGQLDFEAQSKIFKFSMQKIYLMFNEKNFHFSHTFPQRDYHGDKVIQLKRLKLCKKYFKEIFRIFVKEVQLFERRSLGEIKFKGIFFKVIFL